MSVVALCDTDILMIVSLIWRAIWCGVVLLTHWQFVDHYFIIIIIIMSYMRYKWELK